MRVSQGQSSAIETVHHLVEQINASAQNGFEAKALGVSRDELKIFSRKCFAEILDLFRSSTEIAGMKVRESEASKAGDLKTGHEFLLNGQEVVLTTRPIFIGAEATPYSIPLLQGKNIGAQQFRDLCQAVDRHQPKDLNGPLLFQVYYRS